MHGQLEHSSVHMLRWVDDVCILMIVLTSHKHRWRDGCVFTRCVGVSVLPAAEVICSRLL